MLRYEAHRQGHSESTPAPTGSGSSGAGAKGVADGTAGWVSPSAGQAGPEGPRRSRLSPPQESDSLQSLPLSREFPTGPWALCPHVSS